MTDTTQAQAQVAAKEQLVVANEWFGLVENFVITTDEQQEQVVGLLRDVKARYRAIEEKRKEITVPLNQALKAVNDLFRPPREKFEDLERALKSKVAAYLTAKQQANVAALQAASTASTAAEAQTALSFVVPVEAPSGVSVRPVWKFQVTDPDAVPRSLCSPDPKKISAACQYGPDGQPLPVPGVQWFQESSVTVRK